MSSTRPVLVERGLLRVVAQAQPQQPGVVCTEDYSAYDVEIDGQEVLHTFSTFGEALHFLDMLAPEPGDEESGPPAGEEKRLNGKS